MPLSLFDFLDSFLPMWKDTRVPELNRQLRSLGRFKITFAHRHGNFTGYIQFVAARAHHFWFNFNGRNLTVDTYFFVKYDRLLQYPRNRMIELEPGHFYPPELLYFERL